MNAVFADTFFWLALVHKSDAAHDRATRFMAGFNGKIVTTDWVLVEVADALAASAAGRQAFLSLHGDLTADSDVTIVGCNPGLLEEGIQLYGSRTDKQWSLTDCISFVVTSSNGLKEALTGDHHFEQAGLIALLK